MAKKNLFDGVHPAVIAVWAALIASSHLLPAIALVGVGGTLSVSTALLPLAGIFFGPVAGGLCSAIGSFIGDLIQPSGAWLGMFTFLTPTMDTVVAGLLSRGKKTSIAGILLIVGGGAAWMLTAIGRKAYILPLFNGAYGALAGLVCFFVGQKWLSYKEKNIIKKVIATFCCSVAGMLAALLWADLASIVLFKTPAITWKTLAFVSPVERTTFAIGSVIIGIPLLLGLPRIGIYVGPKDPLEEANEKAGIEDEVV